MWFDEAVWRKAANWVVKLASSCEYVFVPREFQHLSPRCLPLEFTHFIDHHRTSAIIFTKGSVDRLGLSWIQNLKSFQLVDIDELFAVMVSRPIKSIAPPEETLVARQTPYLWGKVKQILSGQSVRTSRVADDLSSARPGDPYCLIVNACLANNAGEALLGASAQEVIQQARPDLRCIIADPDVDRTLVANASLVAIGPGGMLYDLMGHEEVALNFQNVANYFRFGYLAREYGVPLFVIGMGSQLRLISRTTVAYIRSSIADAIFVNTRDSHSATVFTDRLEFQGPIVVTPDVCVVYSDMIRKVASRPSERRTVAICGTIGAETVVALDREHQGRTRIILQGLEDAQWFDRCEAFLRARINNLEVLDVRTMGSNKVGAAGPEPLIEAVATSDVLISSRFHAMMVGIIAGVDTVVSGITNDKRHRVCQDLGDQDWVYFHDHHKSPHSEFRERALEAVRSGRRDPSRGRFSPADLEPIRRLLKPTVQKPQVLGPVVVPTAV